MSEGTYDRIVSIEMLEAVGERNWPDYFRHAAQPSEAGRHRDRSGHHHR